MATLNFPDIVPSSISYGIKYNTQINISTLSGAVQTVEVPGARWVSTLSFDDLEPYESRVMAAFLTQLRGAAGRFYLYDFSHSSPRGSALGTPVVAGASQTGSSVTTSGWTVSELGVLEVGDYIQFTNNEVKIVTATVDADVSGNATINFEPPIRTSPDNASTLTLTECKSIMLLDNDEIRWDVNNEGLLANFSISCVEGFY